MGLNIIVKGALALAGILVGGWLVGKLVDTVASENRRLLAAQIAVSPRDFGVLNQQQDLHEQATAPIKEFAEALLDDGELARQLDGLQGKGDTPIRPHGL